MQMQIHQDQLRRLSQVHLQLPLFLQELQHLQ